MRIRPTTGHSARTLRRGFTLLEVLVVVAIIVILAGVGTMYVLPRLEEAKVRRAKIDCEALSQAVETYKLNNGQYPQTLAELTQSQPDGGAALIAPDKIRDPWGKPYQLDPSGPNNGGNKADVFTDTPRGRVGNWGH